MIKENFNQAFAKQSLRGKLAMIASYSEIFISFLVLIGIALLSTVIIKDIYEIFKGIMTGTETISITVFLSTAFELIIGVEFVKMLAKHTPSSAVEVLLYAIARQLIHGSEGHMLDALVGVIAIAVLFAIRKYLSNSILMESDSEYIVNGSTSIHEIKQKVNSNLHSLSGNTIAGFLHNVAQERGDKLKPGFSIHVDKHKFEVYSMDAGLIKQVKIEKEVV